MGMRKGTERGREVVGFQTGHCPSAVSRQRRYRASRAVAIAVGAALMTVPAVATGKGAPCAAHTDSTDVTRAECLRAHRAQVKRDRMQFPPSPTRADVARRVPDWQGFVRLGRCEQPGPSKYGDGVRWDHPGPTWGGGVGLYRGTWHTAGSPYRVFSGNKWETILVADAVRDRFGITAWGAWRCFA